jgi:hypothetical protein
MSLPHLETTGCTKFKGFSLKAYPLKMHIINVLNCHTVKAEQKLEFYYFAQSRGAFLTIVSVIGIAKLA